jgi:hypothetical protein
VTLQRGDRVEVSFTKWGGGAHWTFPLTFLGRDDHGSWAGGAVGTTLSRPASTFQTHQVSLGYPGEIVTLARRSADDVFRSIADGEEPFACAGARWLRDWRAA